MKPHTLLKHCARAIFRLLTFWGLGLVVFALVACRGNLTNPPDRIVIGTTSQIRTLDPADAYEFWAGNILVHLTDRLYTYRPGTTELMPQLARDFPQISEDGLVYRIPLRSGVKFQDGSSFDSGAMAFSLRRFMDKGGAPSFCSRTRSIGWKPPAPTSW